MGFVMSDERFGNFGVESAELINLLTDSQLRIEPGEERVDMCKTIRDIRQEGVDEGIQQGMRQGMLATLRDLVRDDVLTVADAARRAGLSPDEFLSKTATL